MISSLLQRNIFSFICFVFYLMMYLLSHSVWNPLSDRRQKVGRVLASLLHHNLHDFLRVKCFDWFDCGHPVRVNTFAFYVSGWQVVWTISLWAYKAQKPNNVVLWMWSNEHFSLRGTHMELYFWSFIMLVFLCHHLRCLNLTVWKNLNFS